MKVYGESDYKGFLIFKSKTNKNELSKHYISNVEKSFLKDDKVNITIRSKNGDVVIKDYEPGKNEKVDLAIKTWYSERRRQKKRVPELPKNFFSRLFRKKT